MAVNGLDALVAGDEMVDGDWRTGVRAGGEGVSVMWAGGMGWGMGDGVAGWRGGWCGVGGWMRRGGWCGGGGRCL